MGLLRFQRLGLRAESLETDEWISGIEDSLKIRERKPDEQSVRSHLPFEADFVAVMCYYREELECVREWASRVLEYADDYFFGGWRDRAPSGDSGDQAADRTWWDREGSWDMQFMACLVWGSALGDWNFLKKLGGYFRDDIEANVDQSDANRAWLLIVAGVLRGRDWKDLEELRSDVLNGRAKREKLLLAFLEAILFGSDDDLANASSEYFKHYLRTESKKDDLYAPLAFDASFLCRFGAKNGRDVPVPPNMEDHLIRL